jgi:hypothetical protein
MAELTNGDQLLRAYAILSSLRDGLPENHWLGQRWVEQFNTALSRLEAALGISLAEFKLPAGELKRLIETQWENPDTGEHHVTYEQELSCERSVLLQRLNAVLMYFTGLQSGDQAKIGFRRNG